MRFVKINEKKYKAEDIGSVIQESLDFLGENIETLQRELVYDLLLRMITFKIAQEFDKQGIKINNNLNLINLVINKEEFFYNGVTYRDKNLHLSIGYLPDVDISGRKVTKTAFGRID